MSEEEGMRKTSFSLPKALCIFIDTKENNVHTGFFAVSLLRSSSVCAYITGRAWLWSVLLLKELLLFSQLPSRRGLTTVTVVDYALPCFLSEATTRLGTNEEVWGEFAGCERQKIIMMKKSLLGIHVFLSLKYSNIVCQLAKSISTMTMGLKFICWCPWWSDRHLAIGGIWETVKQTITKKKRKKEDEYRTKNKLLFMVENFWYSIHDFRPWKNYKRNNIAVYDNNTVDSISYVLFFVWKNKIARLSDSLQIFRRALLWSHLFLTVWMSSLAQKIMGFLSTRLSVPRIFGRFEWKIENKKYV